MAKKFTKKPHLPLEAVAENFNPLNWKNLKNLNEKIINAYQPYTLSGKLGRTPFTAQFLHPMTKEARRQELLEVVRRLNTARVPIPEAIVGKYAIFTRRVGSKRRAMASRANSVGGYLGRYLNSLNAISKPNTSIINRILKQASVAVAKTHIAGVSHYHPPMGNLIVTKNGVDLIDFKFARPVEVKWDSADSVFTSLQYDFISLRTFWNSFQTENPMPRRLIMRRRTKFFEDMLKQYPMPEPERQRLRAILHLYAVY